jgi:hypothetical protein
MRVLHCGCFRLNRDGEKVKFVPVQRLTRFEIAHLNHHTGKAEVVQTQIAYIVLIFLAVIDKSE